VSNEREQLQRARNLIIQKQFSDARAILHGMPDSQIARQWLAKLDQIAPPQSTPQPAPGPPPGRIVSLEEMKRTTDSLPASEPPSVESKRAPIPGSHRTTGSIPRPKERKGRKRTSSTRTRVESAYLGEQIDDFAAIHGSTLRKGMRYMVSSALIVLGVLMIVGFVIFSWLEDVWIGGQPVGSTRNSTKKTTLTAWEIWVGYDDGEEFTLDVQEMIWDRGGFTRVRIVDRTLIVVPIGAVVLVWLAIRYALGGMQPIHALIALTAMAVLLLGFPFVWEQWSEAEWETRATFSFGEFGTFSAWISKDYSTGEQVLLGSLALGACLLGFLTEYVLPDQPIKLPERGDF
jgi:hypothetical protein